LWTTSTLRLFGEPRWRPPRRSPGLDPPPAMRSAAIFCYVSDDTAPGAGEHARYRRFIDLVLARAKRTAILISCESFAGVVLMGYMAMLSNFGPPPSLNVRSP
jgi:hypothetical protein